MKFYDPFANFEKVVLPNGLTVYCLYLPEKTFESVGFIVHSGALADKVGLEGTAHFVEHLVHQNISLSVPGIRSFFDTEVGRVCLGSTGFWDTNYKFSSTIAEDKTVLQKAFDVFGEMLFGINNFTNRVEEERKVILREFSARFSSKSQLPLLERLNKELVYWHGISRFATALGQSDSITNIAEVDLLDFYQQHYVPQNISVVCIGGCSLNELLNIINNSSLNVFKNGQRNKIVNHDYQLPLNNYFEIDMQKEFAIPIESAVYFSQTYLPNSVIKKGAASILVNVLNRILVDEIRIKKSLSYRLSASVSDRLADIQSFRIETNDIAKENIKMIPDLINEAINLISGHEDHFEDCKKRRLLGFNLADFTVDDILDWAIEDLCAQRDVITQQELYKAYVSLKFSDIVDISKNFLQPEKRWTYIMY